MNTEHTLKACPFCGTSTAPFGPSLRQNGNAHWVECSCGVRGADYSMPESAAAEWNKRKQNKAERN